MKLDAVLCPNDGLAGGAAAAVQELGLKNHVIIVGMDAELAAVKKTCCRNAGCNSVYGLEKYGVSCG